MTNHEHFCNLMPWQLSELLEFLLTCDRCPIYPECKGAGPCAQWIADWVLREYREGEFFDV